MLQVRILLKEYTVKVNTEGALLGDTLETALEHGEKYEELVANIKAVSHSLWVITVLVGVASRYSGTSLLWTLLGQPKVSWFGEVFTF